MSPTNITRHIADQLGGHFASGGFTGVKTAQDPAGLWQTLFNSPPGSYFDLQVAPTAAGVLYLGTGSGMYKSKNHGSTWIQINSGLSDTNVRSIAIDPVNTDTVYVGTQPGVMFKTTTGGE